MRKLDVALFTQQQLREIPYRAYLCAMCVIGDAIRLMYDDSFSPQARRLAERTIAATKLAHDKEISSVREPAARLFQEWAPLMRDDAWHGSGANYTAQVMFEGLAGELAEEREVPPYAARSLVGAAVNGYTGQPEADPGPRRLVEINSNEEADESTIEVRLLRGFAAVIADVARRPTHGPQCDYRRTRADLLDDLLRISPKT